MKEGCHANEISVYECNVGKTLAHSFFNAGLIGMLTAIVNSPNSFKTALKGKPKSILIAHVKLAVIRQTPAPNIRYRPLALTR